MKARDLFVGCTLALWMFAPAASSLYGQESSGNGGKEAAEKDATPTPPEDPVAPTPPPTPVSTADIDPGHVVYYDLETGRLAEPLPFDVQFYLRVPVADNVKSLEGRYVGDTRPFLCQGAFPKTHVYADYGFGPREPAPSERRQIQPIGLARFFKDPASPLQKDKRHAELNVVNGLLPNRYYCFEFTQVKTAEGDPVIFRQALAAAVDLTMRGADQPIAAGSRVEQQLYEQLRQNIIAAIGKQLKPGERLIVPAGSFLDERTTTRSLPAKSKTVFDQLVQAQITRGLQIGNLTRNADSAVRSLTDIVSSPALLALKRTAAQNPLPETLVPAFRGTEKGLQLADLQSDTRLSSTLEMIAQGMQAFPVADSVTAIPFDQSWSPDDLKARKANLEHTRDVLGELQRLTDQLSRDQGLRQLAIGPDIDLSTLDKDLKKVLADFDAILQRIDNLSRQLDTRQSLLNALVSTLAKEIVETFLVEGSTTAAYEVRANWYMGMDLGAAWSPDIEDFFTYVGANIYFRPVNKKAPLRWSDFHRGQLRSELAKRFSLTIGVVLNDLTRDGQFQGLSQQNLTQGLIADKPMVALVGFRLNSFFRIAAGALVFKDRNPDPLVNESRLAWSPMVSLSIDWDLRGFLRDRLTQRPFP